MIVLENYRGLVISEALKVWRRLPKHTQAWIGLDDMVSSGMYFIWRKCYEEDKSRPGRHNLWNPKGGRSFGSYVKSFLYKDFDNAYVAPYQEAISRCEKNTISIQVLEEEAKKRDQGEWSFEAQMKSKPRWGTYNFILTDAMGRLYDTATLDLKTEIAKWFLDGADKMYMSGSKFTALCKEFRVLADNNRLSYDDCQYFMRSPVCLAYLSQKVSWIPYDLEVPPPDVFRRGAAELN